MSPEEPEDAERLETHRGQGTGGSGLDLLPEERQGNEAAPEGSR
ncbi:MAG TPA: hypothetical protein VE990_02950 [Acidimicrobiales bacterium]|nr:hypothetical protein [Acidimicrobiales bacterium]